jgi:cell division protein FtsA
MSIAAKHASYPGTVLDIGGSKYMCAHARISPDGINVLATAHAKALHFTSTISNLEAFENILLKTIEGVERRANISIRNLTISLGTPFVTNGLVRLNLSLNREMIEQKHVELLFDSLEKHVTNNQKKLLHFIPQYYVVDGVIVMDPRGLTASKFGVSFLVTMGNPYFLDTIEGIFDRCRLPISKVFSSSYASAIGTLLKEERMFGVVHLDFGGKTTDVTVFNNGNVRQFFSIPLGGEHLTQDISRGLSISPREAERIKALHGSLIYEKGDEHRFLEIEGGENVFSSRRITKQQVSNILKARVDEILESVTEQLKIAGLSEEQRYVITGGGSALLGLKERVALKLKAPVRVGFPLQVSGGKNMVLGPEFSTCAGLLQLTRESEAGDQTVIPKKTKGFFLWDKIKSIIYDTI